MAEIAGTYQPIFRLKLAGKQIPFSRVRFISALSGTKVVIDTLKNKTFTVGQIVTGELKISKDIAGVNLFTCEVVSVSPGENQEKRITCREPYALKLRKKIKAASWRKTTFRDIAADILDSCSVEQHDLSNCPTGELSRFSLRNTTGYRAIDELITAWKLKTGEKLIFLPGISGEIKIGKEEDIVHVYPFTHNLEAGKNVIGRSGRWVTSFALPVLYGQSIVVDGIESKCNYSVLTVSASTYRTGLEVLPV